MRAERVWRTKQRKKKEDKEVLKIQIRRSQERKAEKQGRQRRGPVLVVPEDIWIPQNSDIVIVAKIYKPECWVWQKSQIINPNYNTVTLKGQRIDKCELTVKFIRIEKKTSILTKTQLAAFGEKKKKNFWRVSNQAGDTCQKNTNKH